MQRQKSTQLTIEPYKERSVPLRFLRSFLFGLARPHLADEVRVMVSLWFVIPPTAPTVKILAQQSELRYKIELFMERCCSTLAHARLLCLYLTPFLTCQLPASLYSEGGGSVRGNVFLGGQQRFCVRVGR